MTQLKVSVFHKYQIMGSSLGLSALDLDGAQSQHVQLPVCIIRSKSHTSRGSRQVKQNDVPHMHIYLFRIGLSRACVSPYTCMYSAPRNLSNCAARASTRIATPINLTNREKNCGHNFFLSPSIHHGIN